MIHCFLLFLFILVKQTSYSRTLGAIYFGTMKTSLTIFLGLLINYGIAQQLNIKYRTATDSTEKLHYLVFTDKSNCKLTYPIRNHGDAMFPQKREFNLTYRVTLDTITFQGPDLDSNNRTIGRLLKSKFIATADRQIFDIVSGYTYVDNELVSDKYDIYSIDGKIYKQKRVKTDGYGLVRKDYRPNRKLKKRVKQINADSCEITVIRGKKAYDKYGLVGMNGVIEIEEKK
jgi:hypothetical protein